MGCSLVNTDEVTLSKGEHFATIGEAGIDPMGLLFLDMYLAKYESELPEQEADHIVERLEESNQDLERQRSTVWFVNETTNEHGSRSLQIQRNAPDHRRIPDWFWELSCV